MDDTAGLQHITIRMDEMIALLERANDDTLQSIIADEGSGGDLLLHNAKRILRERHMDFHRIRVITRVYRDGIQIELGEEWFDMPCGGTPVDLVAKMLKFQGRCDEMLGGMLATHLAPYQAGEFPVQYQGRPIEVDNVGKTTCPWCNISVCGKDEVCSTCDKPMIPTEESIEAARANAGARFAFEADGGIGKQIFGENDSEHKCCRRCGTVLSPEDACCPGCRRDCTRDERPAENQRLIEPCSHCNGDSLGCVCTTRDPGPGRQYVADKKDGDNNDS